MLKELTGYEGSLQLDGKEDALAEKFASFFPAHATDRERTAAFLSQDVTAIRQDYMQTFSPPPKKKKRSRKTTPGTAAPAVPCDVCTGPVCLAAYVFSSAASKPRHPSDTSCQVASKSPVYQGSATSRPGRSV